MITKHGSFRIRTTSEFDKMLTELSERLQLPRSKVVEKLVETEYKAMQKQSNKEYGCETYKGNCDKCNMYYLCDRVPLTK